MHGVINDQCVNIFYLVCRKYITITCPDQRSKYKEDFNAEYDEYRNLHSVIDRVSKKFAHLEERLRQEERGTEGYEVDCWHKKLIFCFN